MEQFDRLFANQNHEHDLSDSKRIPQGRLRARQSALLRHGQGHVRWRVPMGPPDEFLRRIPCERLQSSVFLQVRLLRKNRDSLIMERTRSSALPALKPANRVL